VSGAAVAGMSAEARGVARVYADGARVTAVEGVSLALAPGEFAALRGRSGSGKTTLLCLLAGLERPTSGQVLLDGVDLAAAGLAGRTRATRGVGFALQGAPAIRRMPVWENVSQGLVPLGLPSRERLARAEEALERVGLRALAWRRPEQLSAGERQRMALARALVHGPRLLLADEPTSNLDPASAEGVADLLADVHRRGCTLIVASHDPTLLARADRLLDLASGRLAASPPPSPTAP